MDEKDTLKIEQELENKKKIPKEIKDGIDRTFFYNNIMAILVMLYFALINCSYIFLEGAAFERTMKYLAVLAIVSTVIMFELAYKKDNFKIALIGIELFMCSLLSVYIPYIYLYTNPIYKKFMMIIPIFFAIYYVAKTIAAYIFRHVKHRLNISDVKEIINYDENKSYIDEDSVKTLKENKKRKELEKKLQKERIKKENSKSSKKTNNKANNNTSRKKATTQKKKVNTSSKK